jgi:serine protease Do
MINTDIHATPIFLPNDLSFEISSIVQRVDPSVVQVRAEGRGGGAGFVWSADGQILTNQHVVGGLDQVEILFPDGKSYTGPVIARNQTLDLALVKIDGINLPTVPIADASRLRVGELVIAIGHPWGQRGVVTMGIVSGNGEIPLQNGRKAQYIRSDVRLAPGNSGGPLLNTNGEVVGINAMIFGGDLSVAIPSHVASAWVAGLLNGGGKPVTLGVQVQQVELRGLNNSGHAFGLLIVGIAEGSLADRAGLMVGDVLLDVNGSVVPDPVVLRDTLAQYAASGLQIRLLRGGTIETISVSTGGEQRV